MPKRRRPSKSIQILTILVLVISGIFFLFTGTDPWGLFTELEIDLSGNQPLSEESVDGQWWQVHFTEPNTIDDPNQLRGSVEETLIEYIERSQNTILIAAFEFDLTPVAEALIEAHQRGVQIRWVTDDENGLEADREEGHGQFALLQEAGIQVKADERSALMHNKFIVFDQEIVWTGSTNLTSNGIFRNNNNVIVIRSPTLASFYEDEFAEMWAGQFGPSSPSTARNQEIIIQGSHVRVLFAPEDNVVDWLVPIIQRADSSIRFMAFSFTDDVLGEAILSRAESGVDVAGIFETRGSETEFSELTNFYCAGLSVRQDGNPGIMHHKAIIIDSKILIAGSFNFSVNANEANDENVILISNPEIAAKYLREFNRLWREAKDPKPGDLPCG